MTQSIDELRDLILALCPTPDRHATAIPGLTLMRAHAPTLPMGTLYQPVVCFVAQGGKRLMLGERVFEYNAANYLIVSVDLPVTGGIHKASPEEPYLAVSMALDRGAIADLLLEMGEARADSDVGLGMAVTPVTEDLLSAAVRLVRLLDKPRDAAILAPLVTREILYRLLCGGQGGLMREIALADSRLSRISRAIAWIRDHYAEPVRIEAVAEVARMSPASLHRHFKAVTMMSPLQYQKQIRLQEARRLLLAERSDAASIGFSVGYESPSQFSREYARLFGAPPARDAARLRGLAADGVPA